MRTSVASVTTVIERLRGIRNLVGNTPLLEVRFEYEGEPRVIYAKAEHLNLTGSIKDRMAYHILRQAYAEGTIRAGDTIAEATSGNTGISFSAIGRALGHRVVIFMPDWMSRERMALIQSLGAEIRLVSSEEGGFRGAIGKAEQLAAESRAVFLPNQFSNLANVEAHEQTTGPEIRWQMEAIRLRPDAFVAAVGTGGTVMGVGRALRRFDRAIRVHPAEPSESPTLSTKYKVGKHRVQGVSDEFVPAILDLDGLDEIVSVHDGDAVLMSQKLAQGLGLAVGISSGMNFLAALKVQNELGRDAVVVTVFPDDNKKYLSTDLFAEEPVVPEYLAPRVELQAYYAHGRVCQACFAG